MKKSIKICYWILFCLYVALIITDIVIGDYISAGWMVVCTLWLTCAYCQQKVIEDQSQMIADLLNELEL
jgi:hypothetical protein